MADRKHYVAPPQGRELTEDDALAMGYALFDEIAREQAEKARAAADELTRMAEDDGLYD